jgi:histidyl-tRNA synthetase
MALSTQPYKGTRDYYPDDMRVRKWMFSVLSDVCESFGYEQYDGPVLEPLELYTAKTSEEIINEQSFSFEDRGKRKVIMRPEMTPTVSRMVAAKRQELGYPLRLYAIPNFFRYERPQKGRLREFWQLNADIFGVEGVEADVEIIQLADSIMKAFGAKDGSYEIRVNSRRLLNKRIKEAGVKSSIEEIIRILDRYDKQDRKKTLEQLIENSKNPVKLLESIENDGASDEVKRSINILNQLGVKSAKPVETLARGFDYYTDIVFEVFDTNPENNRSMFGGGRYDGLVGEFGVETVPTVGFGMGDATLLNFLESNNLLPTLKPATDAVLIGIDVENDKLSELSNRLRNEGLNIAVDFTNRKIDKKIKAAEKLKVENILIVGENEIMSNKFTLKNLVSGEEFQLAITQVKSKINK